MRPTKKPIIEQGVRSKLALFLVSNKRAYVQFQSFGISARKIKALAVTNALPSLREALCIDCVTNGACNVYSWVDTEAMEQRSNVDCEQQVTELYNVWPKSVLQEHRALLRMHMVQRLGAPSRNVLAIVTKLGHNEINKDARRLLAKKIADLPVHVEDDCSDEQLQRAIERRERSRARAIAFVKGKRNSY